MDKVEKLSVRYDEMVSKFSFWSTKCKKYSAETCPANRCEISDGICKNPKSWIDQSEALIWALTNEKHELTLTGQRCVNYFIRCKYYNLIKINIINLTVTLENKIKILKSDGMFVSLSVRLVVRMFGIENCLEEV